ncbi:glycosyltransferase 87 family protein [Actinoplanes sp. NPDC024001]|uniref:glycosyltransferase 87 family protein n=1 Tax=Actinoplanes sp. NPDC024001 TaxID=3154598 RepID=UPI0033F2B47A
MATLGCLGALALITVCIQRYGLSTLAVELAAIRGWLAGDSLYAYRVPGGETSAALSPALALLLTPLAVLPLPVAGWLLALAGVTALVLATVILAGPIARRYGHRRSTVVLAVATLAMLTGPVRATFGLGRPDLLLFGLVVADLVALRRAAWARSRATWWPARPASQSARDRSPYARARRAWATGAWAGVGTGLATALSMAPVLVIGYLLITRQRRAALTALGTAVAVTLGALLIAPDETLTWYGTVLWELDRVAPISAPDNQSLAGVLARLYGFATPPVLVWFSFGVLMLAVGLIRARSAHADGDEIAAFTLVALTGAVAGPVTGQAETVWLIPAVLILADAAMRRRLSVRLPRSARFAGAGFAVVALLCYVLLLAAPHWAYGWTGLALALILLVNALPWRHGSASAIPVRRPVKRPPAIPVPRGARS